MKNGGEFKPIGTAAPASNAELLPQTARQMQHLSIIRSISTPGGRSSPRASASGFVPNPPWSIRHSVRSSATSCDPGTEVAVHPTFRSTIGRSPGYLGMSSRHSPSSFGQNRNLDLTPEDRAQMPERLELLKAAESRFIRVRR